MKVVALISGGKDSCYNMMQCVASGHEIVALANIEPHSKDEIDSFMYQSVGHEGIALISQAMNVPLYRRQTLGVSHSQERNYEPTESDEVEDLYLLLKQIQEELKIEGVSSGAILSDYQRIRVENVCSRLRLTSLAYLWRRDQSELLQEMIDCKINAIIIKVASLGLDPLKHLGKTIEDIQPHLMIMKEKYGLNVCGEGGEFETFTLDCPLYRSYIIIEESETVIHSNNDIAPVGYLRLKKLQLVSKTASLDIPNQISLVPIKAPNDFVVDVKTSSDDYKLVYGGDPLPDQVVNITEHKKYEICCSVEHPVVVASNSYGLLFYGGLTGCGETTKDGVIEALNKLKSCLEYNKITVRDVCLVNLYVQDLSKYSEINKAYCDLFAFQNPPARACVECPLSKNCHVIIEALAFRSFECTENEERFRFTMHVQGISHWAPANIGPYSQAVKIGSVIHVAGQIGLVPGNMTLIRGVKEECKLSLRHADRIIKAMDENMSLNNVIQGVCYVTSSEYITLAQNIWKEKVETNNALIDYVVVSQLPRKASIEWQFQAHRHSEKFESEKNEEDVEGHIISIDHCWNSEDSTSGITCHVYYKEEKTAELSESVFTQITCTILTRLDKFSSTDTVKSLKIFYGADKKFDFEAIYADFNNIKNSNFVYTFIPVCNLISENCVLSVCGLSCM